MKYALAVSGLLLVACGGAALSEVDAGAQDGIGRPPVVTVGDAGEVEASPDASDASDATSDVVTLATDAGCEAGRVVTGSCTTNMATSCTVYFDDPDGHHAACAGHWDPSGECFDRDDPTTGGCDYCDRLQWSFMLGGNAGGGDAATARPFVRQACLDNGGHPVP